MVPDGLSKLHFTNMKKTFITLAVLAAASVAAADTQKLATMSELVGTGTLGANVAQDLTMTGTVYTFSDSSVITNITNSAVTNALANSSGYLTIAAWINASSVSENSIFSIGGQNDGFKFALKDGHLQVTTKGTKDSTVGSTTVSANQWTLVAVGIDLSGGHAATHFYVGDSTDVTADIGNWSTPNPADKYGIGTGNSGGARDAYSGSIANLTVLYSDTALSNADIQTMVGAMPTAITTPDTPAVPEPTTATLSLLALAGLCARRRRK